MTNDVSVLPGLALLDKRKKGTEDYKNNFHNVLSHCQIRVLRPLILNPVTSHLSLSPNENKNILKVINEEASVRTGKWGPYVYYKTNTMKKPKFIKIPKGTTINEIDNNWLQSKI